MTSAAGNQLANEQARDRRVAVGKMKEIPIRFFTSDGVAVHAFSGRRIKIQAGKSGQSESPGILRRYCIDTYAEKSVRH